MIFRASSTETFPIQSLPSLQVKKDSQQSGQRYLSHHLIRVYFEHEFRRTFISRLIFAWHASSKSARVREKYFHSTVFHSQYFDSANGTKARFMNFCSLNPRFLSSKSNFSALSNLKFLCPSQDSPLKSKVAIFNQKVNEHKSNQLDNPFSGSHQSRSRSPKLFLKPEEYGK